MQKTRTMPAPSIKGEKGPDKALDPHRVPGPDWVYRPPTLVEMEVHHVSGGPILHPDESPRRKMHAGEMRGHIDMAKIYGKREPSEEEVLTYWKIWRKLWISKNGVAPPRPEPVQPKLQGEVSEARDPAYWDK